MTDIKGRLTEVMADLNMKDQKELAVFCGVSEGLVTQWFNGTTNLGPKPLKAFAKKTRYNLDWLCDGRGGKYRDASEDPVTPDDDKFTLIPQLDMAASCGCGKYHEHVVVKGGLAFKRSSLRDIGVSENTARVIYADGSSMEPSIEHGRVVLINTTERLPIDGKIFLICDPDGNHYLKRLVREFHENSGEMRWFMRSDNSDKRQYPDKLLPDDDRTYIVGRAVWTDKRL